MKKFTLSFLFAITLLFITASTFEDGFTGGLIPHMFTTKKTATKFGSDYLVNFETQNRKGVFDITEDIFIATSLVGYQSTGQLSTTNYPHIQIDVSANAGRTGALVNINKITQFNYDSVVSSVSFSIIVIGSNFDGFNKNANSSFVFAKNGKMQDTRDGQDIFYDFGSDSMPSPFNYDGSTQNLRCGAFKVDGNWRIEDVDCQYKGYHFFITGFSRVYANQVAGNIPFNFQIQDSANLGSNVNKINANPLNINFLDDTNSDGVQLRINSISITPNDSFDKGIQLSMIFVGLRQKVTGQYPGQTLYPNDFKYNHFTFQLTVPQPVDGTTTAPIASNTFFTDYIAVQDTYSSQTISHIFCGFSSLKLTFDTAPITGEAYNFQFQDIKYQKGSSVFQAVFTDTPSISIAQVRATCQTFTLKNSCNTEKSDVNLDGVPTVKPAATKVDYIVYAPNSVASRINEYSNILGIQQTSTAAGSIVHTLTFSNIENSGYQGVIQIVALGSTGTHDLKIEAFGKTVVDQHSLDLTGADQFVFAFFNFDTTGNNKVIITITNTDTNTFITELGFVLNKHTNLIDFEGNCVNQCQQVPGKDIGISIRTDPPTCLLCQKDTLNRQFFPSLNNVGGCDCQPNRYSNIGVCTPCDNVLCQTCKIDAPSNCTKCIDNSVLADPSDQTSGCNCIDGFYQASDSDYTKCFACPVGCSTCSSPTLCGSCVSATTRLGTDDLCKCISGYYEAGNVQCQRCPLECKQCESSTKCTQCDESKKFIAKDDACKCQDSYFLVVGSDQATCEKCDPSCKTCSGTANNCVQCKDDTYVNNNGVCQCKAGFTEFAGNCIDTNCQSIDPFCQTCYILLTTAQPLCRTCVTGRFLNNRTNMCECPVGKYQSNSNCLDCAGGCQKCSSSSTCDICAFGSIRNNDGSCSCPKGTFLNQIHNQLYCKDCADNCADCVGTEDFCKQCKHGFVSVNNQCECPEKSYLSADLRSCIMCPVNCITCPNGICDSCQAGSTLNQGACVKDCPNGTFPNAGQCSNCSQFCLSCVSQYNCMTCANGYYKFAGTCRTQCPDKSFPVGGGNIQLECISCTSPCHSCVGSATNCTSCQNGFILLNQECLSNCPDNTYFSGNTCLPCDSNCFNCYANSTNCVSCPVGKYLVNTRCQDQCPDVVINGVCTDNCPAGSYLSGQSCIPCADQCGNCKLSANNCTSCKNGLFVYQGNCVVSCPVGTLQIQDFCANCDPTCEGCAGTVFNCTSCKAGFYRLSGRCVENCPDGYYTDMSQGICKPCDAYCKICSGPGQCQLCEDFTLNPTQQCNNECGANCIKCQNNECILCAQGTIWTGITCLRFCPPGSQPVNGICVCDSGFIYQNQCFSMCPEGTIPIDGRCVQCDPNCKTCQGQVTFCTACQDGLVLDPVSGRCESQNQCAFGRYRDLFGVCKIICSQDSYYLASACYDNQCPPGYQIDKVNQACIQSSTITGCTKPKFLQGRVCVNTCSPGFYPNPDNRVCQGCPPGCYSCLSASFCSSCNSGFSLSNDNLCIISQGCENGKVKYRDVCLGFCPIGTYQKEGFCLRQCSAQTKKMGNGCYKQCPTTLSTPDACVNSCPNEFSRVGNDCVLNSQNCIQGQFFDALNNGCFPCASTCKTCQGTFNSCTSCPQQYVLDGTMCKPGTACAPGQYLSTTGCAVCPQKCGTCINDEQCLTCAENYVNTGADCVKNTNVLTPVQLQTLSVTQRNSTAFVQIRPTIIPNDLDLSIQSAFLQVVPTDTSISPIINIWIEENDVWVALRYQGDIPNYQVFFVLNSLVLDGIYRNMGYITANAYTQAIISNNLPPTPDNVQIPLRGFNAGTSKSYDIDVLNSRAINAIKYAIRSRNNRIYSRRNYRNYRN